MEVYAHKELASCGNMSLNNSSSLALLAGRRCYAIIDLSNPSQTVIREGRHSKWEVVCSQWSVQEERNLAVASNNRVEMVRVGEGELSVTSTLSAHTRIITDLSWHTQNANLMASSSADNYIYLWDTRDLRRPKAELQAVQGASKIEWNKVSGKLLASTHNGEVKLWDIRKSTSPVQSIAAHLSRIYSLDWSRDHEDSLATSSQDSTVMFWNLANPSKAEATIKTPGAPVWQLQHTPFGTGLLTLVVSTVLKGENNLNLWSRTDLRSPINTFYGHTDLVLNFGWRCPRPEDLRTSLVTWSKDGTLRLWEIDADLQRKCGQEIEEGDNSRQEEEVLDTGDGFHEEEETAEEGLHRLEEEDGAVIVSSPVVKNPHFLRKRNQDSESEHSVKEEKSMKLRYEFQLLNISSRLHVLAQDEKDRIFTVSGETASRLLVLHVHFPLSYPNRKAPDFSWLGPTSINTVIESTILNKIRAIAQKAVNKNRRCLEPCLRQFEASLEALDREEQMQLQLNNPGIFCPSLQEAHDHNIPFPRSSGARFCGDGHLVTFGWTRQYSVPVARDETDGPPLEEVARTPRALTSMLGVSNGAASPKYSVSGICPGQSPSQEQPPYFPFKARVSRVRFANTKSRMSMNGDDLGIDRKSSGGRIFGWGRANTPTVTIYSCLGLQPPGWKQLAANYLVPSSGLGAFLSRKEICERNAAIANQVERADLVHLWTIAGLTAGGQDEAGVPWAQHPMGRRLLLSQLDHYVKLKDVQTVAMISAVFSPLKKSLLGGNGKGGKVQKKLSVMQEEEIKRQRKEEADASMLDPDLSATYDCYIKVYSDLLYTWRMLIPRVEIAKCLSSSEEDSQRFGFDISCLRCGTKTSSPTCLSCRAFTLTCALCRLSCKGLASLCHACGHGGHPDHLRQWFSNHDVCPVGCGCPCPTISVAA